MELVWRAVSVVTVIPARAQRDPKSVGREPGCEMDSGLVASRRPAMTAEKAGFALAGEKP